MCVQDILQGKVVRERLVRNPQQARYRLINGIRSSPNRMSLRIAGNWLSTWSHFLNPAR